MLLPACYSPVWDFAFLTVDSESCLALVKMWYLWSFVRGNRTSPSIGACKLGTLWPNQPRSLLLSFSTIKLDYPVNRNPWNHSGQKGKPNTGNMATWNHQLANNERSIDSCKEPLKSLPGSSAKATAILETTKESNPCPAKRLGPSHN